MKEQRKFPRVHTLNMISLQTTGKEGFLTYDTIGRTLDISVGGALVETVMKIPEDTLLKVSIQNKEEILTVKGKIIHSRENSDGRYATGILFLDLTSEETQQLDKWVNEVEE